MFEKPKSECIGTYHGNSFSSNPMSVIFTGAAVGLSLMMLSIFIKAPAFLSVAALIGGILLVYGFKIGKTRYELYAEGIAQEIQLFIPSIFSKAPVKRFIAWKEIKAFKNDVDLKRNLGQYEYLKLYLRKAPGEIWITNENDPQAFILFRDKFLALMPAKEAKKTKVAPLENEHTSVYESVLPAQNLSKNETLHIKEKPSFYKGRAGKLLSLIFVAFCIAIFVFGAQNGMRNSNWYKLAAVVVPGTVYLIYRSFGSQRKDS